MTVTIFGVDGLGEVRPGDDLADVIGTALEGLVVEGDVVVVASKIVAKAQGRTVSPLPGMAPDQARRRLALEDELVAVTPSVAVVRTGPGWVCANAGIDASNVPGGELLRLPEQPDVVAEELRSDLGSRHGVRIGVVVTDTFGRAWREGQTDVALGVAGITPLRDERGSHDRDGMTLSVTLVAVADQIAGAADLVRDKAAGIPVVIVRGLAALVIDEAGPGGAALIRPTETDLFAHGRGWLGHKLASAGRQAPSAPAVRAGSPTEQDLDLVAAAVGSSRQQIGGRTTDRLELPDGLAAGRAEAVLLDLGFEAQAGLDAEGWHVRLLARGA